MISNDSGGRITRNKSTTCHNDVYIVRVATGIVLIVLLASCFLLSACTPYHEVFKENGTVKYVPLEGGFFGIVGDSGKQYYPINLSRDLMEDHIRVYFIAKERQEYTGIYMWGRPVLLIDIIKIQ
jgi:hypothetical protein